MPDLNPAPSSLGLASPALGPWFETSRTDASDLAALASPNPDLSVNVNLTDGAIWNAPAGGLLSYYVMGSAPPPGLATFRRADSGAPFVDGAFVAMFALFPEVSRRLGMLMQAAPRPDAAAAPTADQRTRPVITHFAMELPAGTVTTWATLLDILPNLDASDLHDVADGQDTDDKKVAYLGLTTPAALANGQRPMTALRRPETDGRRLLENTSGGIIGAKLWAFTQCGRAYDPGAVAALWRWLTQPAQWENLWASSDSARQRVVDAPSAAKTVLLCNAHQGPLAPAIKSRVTGNLTDLTPVGSSDVLYSAGTSPVIALSTAPDSDEDTAPVPRVAPLPAGPYAAPNSATPFAGWAGPNAFDRDFQRVAVMDIEGLLTGLSRDVGTAQADPRRRITAAPNTADPLFLPSADAVASEVMDRFDATGATVTFIAPELDQHYGPQAPAALGASNPFDGVFDYPVADAVALKGSGATVGNTAEDQNVVLRFDASLPPDAWVRAWPAGRDTETGRRFRMTGGAALSDGAGSALLILPLPNGKNGDGTDAVEISYDLSVSTTTANRLWTDRRTNRPAVDSTPALDIAALGANQSLYCPETAAAPTPGAGEIAPGHTLLVVNGAVADEDFSAIDPTSLRSNDFGRTLSNRAGTGDRIVTNDPAFTQTTAGDLPTTLPDAPAFPGSADRVHEAGFHTGSTAQEVFDFAAFDDAGNRGVIGAVTGRTPWHEAPPPAQGHPGVNAAPEIHGEGLAIAGPAADALRLVIRERRPSDLIEFVTGMGTPFSTAAMPTSPGPWSALLETAASGTHGDLLISALPDSVTPGTIWDNSDTANPGIKQRIDAVLAGLPGGITVDSLVDSTNFDDDVASAAFDRLLDKNRNGAQQFARAALAAIARAEDLIWLQTPAIDGETWTDSAGDIALMQALVDRLAANPALRVVIVLPSKFLPKRNTKLDAVRKSAIGGALQALKSAAEDRVAWVAPWGGPQRNFHMSATTMIIDDTVMFTGAAHGWRRGLVFDAALTGALFDERLTFGRPQSVSSARRTLAGAMLSLDPDLVPDTAPALVAALKAQSAGGGFARTNPNAHTSKADPTPMPDREIWNPAPSSSTDWVAMIAALAGDAKTEFENGTR